MIDELVRVRGIGPTAAERLMNAGIKSIEEIANSKPEELAWIKGIGMLSSKKIIENALELINLEKGIQKVLNSIKDSIEYIKKQGFICEFSPMDASRTEPGYIYQILEAVMAKRDKKEGDPWTGPVQKGSRVPGHPGYTAEGIPIHPGRCAGEVAKFIEQEAADWTIIADGGEASGWIGGALTAHRPGQLHLGSSGANGTIGQGPCLETHVSQGRGRGCFHFGRHHSMVSFRYGLEPESSVFAAAAQRQMHLRSRQHHRYLQGQRNPRRAYVHQRRCSGSPSHPGNLRRGAPLLSTADRRGGQRGRIFSDHRV